MSHDLATFFATMGPFLRGDLTAHAVEEQLGPSPSGTKRLALYRDLVRGQEEDLFDSLFPAVRRACEAHGKGTWRTLTERFARENPPFHWEPNRAACTFAAFLGKNQEALALPPCLEELADYAYIRFAASVAPDPADGVGLESSLFIRHYDYDVVSFTSGVEPGPGGEPALAPAALVVAWSRVSHRVVEIRPSLAALAAIGRRLGDERVLRRADAPSLAEVEDADADMVSRGVLASK
jgi:hypothetical protein